ncbi:MAG TPA: hypothetical protein VHO25_23655 [Polyangiaceae bacterium]|nr:hypothetical protein [Polyangiaceae bacterium]
MNRATRPHRDRRRTRLALAKFATLLASLLFVLQAHEAFAQTSLPRLSAKYYWSSDGSGVLADFSFSAALDAEIQTKLSRGLPTSLVFTGLVYARGKGDPIATTVQTCRVTWHVWEEMYRVEITRSNSPAVRRHWTPTVTGVTRRCAQAEGLLIADRRQVGPNPALFIRGKLQINPISPEVYSKIRRWISRPARTRTVTTGSALFSTFTGLFMQRIEDAERTISIETETGSPTWVQRVATEQGNP